MGTLARSFKTRIARRAGVSIVTSRHIRFVIAAFLTATVVGARVSIVAGKARASCACTVLAQIAQRTRVPVVAKGNHILKGTSAKSVATIHGAWIVIVAVDRCSDTDPLFAMVGDGANITVQAFALVDRFVDASGFTGATIYRAVVSIVARTLICQAVAIIVDSVTGLRCGHGRVTLREPLFGAQPNAVAFPSLVSDGTNGRERGFNREFRTGTHTGRIDALVTGGSVGRFHLLTRVT